jgi:hypothetical protein
MIDKSTLLSFSNFFADERQLEKDYLINLALKTISVNKLSNLLEFKGGTALYMFHGLDRFSEDIDFTYIGDASKLYKGIDSLIGPVIKDFNLSYNIKKNKGNVVVKDKNGVPVGTRTELFIEGPLFKSTGISHKIKIDISARRDTLLKPEAARMTSRYADIGEILLYKMPIGEILAEKLCTIIERKKARDIYDAYFIMKNRKVRYDEKMLIGKLKKRDEEFERAILLHKINDFNEHAWKEELFYLVKGLPALNEVKKFIDEEITGK